MCVQPFTHLVLPHSPSQYIDIDNSGPIYPSAQLRRLRGLRTSPYLQEGSEVDGGRGGKGHPF